MKLMNLFFQVLSLQNFIFFLPYSLHHHIFSLRPNYLSVYGVSELLKFFLFLLLYLQIPLRSEVDWLPGLWLLLLHIVFDLPRIVNVFLLLYIDAWFKIKKKTKKFNSLIYLSSSGALIYFLLNFLVVSPLISILFLIVIYLI